MTEYKIGMVVEGQITGLQPYGAFVALDESTQGLIHISEVQHGYTPAIKDILSVGQAIQVKIIDLDEYTQKISLSLRALEKKQSPASNRRKHYFTNHKKKIGFKSLAEKMPQWIEKGLKEFT